MNALNTRNLPNAQSRLSIAKRRKKTGLTYRKENISQFLQIWRAVACVRVCGVLLAPCKLAANKHNRRAIQFAKREANNGDGERTQKVFVAAFMPKRTHFRQTNEL